MLARARSAGRVRARAKYMARLSRIPSLWKGGNAVAISGSRPIRCVVSTLSFPATSVRALRVLVDRIRFNANAVSGHKRRPVDVLHQINVVNDNDLCFRTIEQRDACSWIVVAGGVKHPVELRQAVISEHRMHLSRHLLRICVVPARQLLQIQLEVARHDARRREIGEVQIFQDSYCANHPALHFFYCNRALGVCKPLVLVKHRLNQRRGKVASEVKHAVSPCWVVVTIGPGAAVIERTAAVRSATDVLGGYLP